jgi:predicted DNA-binding protein (MmcQ/YjbR family)
MNADLIRRYCLSFPQAAEKLQWGETLCFKVAGKIFAMLSLDAVPPRLSFKTDPEKFAELVELDGVSPAPYVGRYNWVLVERLDVVGQPELEDLIAESYRMVCAKAPKRRVRPRKSPRRAKAGR